MTTQSIQVRTVTLTAAFFAVAAALSGCGPDPVTTATTERTVTTTTEPAITMSGAQIPAASTTTTTRTIRQTP